MNLRPHGIIPALATPMGEDESIDEDGLRKLVARVIEHGVHGVFAAGTQGEFYGLSAQEKRRVFQIVVEEAAGRVPVYAGTGAPTTRETITLTAMAAELGVSAASVLTPYFIRPRQDELIHHYEAVARAVDLPILLYANPGLSDVSLEPGTVAQLAQIDGIIGIKDSSGNLNLTADYIGDAPAGFSVLAGNDGLIFSTLELGGAGAIAATANVAPRLVVAIYEHVRAGKLEAARAAQAKLARLRKTLGLGTFPVVIKEALHILGVCGPRARSPIMPLSAEARNSLARALDELHDYL